MCDVCSDTGEYPVINSKGRHLYSIRCPECFGTGLPDGEAEKEAALLAKELSDKTRYEQAMRDVREYGPL